VNPNIHSPFSYFFDLLDTGDHLSSLANAEVNLNELRDRVPDNLENTTPESAEIKGYLDPSVINTDSCLLTIGQTCGYLLSDAYTYSIPFSFRVNGSKMAI
jgi:hypothetical protein